MHSQVRKDRQEASAQIVIQGFEPWKEGGDPVAAFARRDTWCLELVSKLANVPKQLIKMQASHGTAADRLSRLSILTLQSSSLAAAVARGAGSQKQMFDGGTMVTVRRQTCVYDRLCSCPVKIAMEVISREEPRLRNAFRPEWKRGHLWSATGELIGIWTISVQKARIRLHLQERFVIPVRENMSAGIDRLQFGPAEADGGGSGRREGRKEGRKRRQS